MADDCRREPLSSVAYTHDGTLEGLLSCIFATYENHEMPNDIVSEEAYLPRLGQSVRPIETDFARARRVRRGIVMRGGDDAFEAVVRASTSDDYDAGLVVYRFVHYLMDRKARRNLKQNVTNDLANPVVGDVMRLRRRACNEEEKLRQFLRFSELKGGIWFAKCHPSCSVVPLIMGHFQERFGSSPFMIFDEAHTLTGVSDGVDWRLVRAAPDQVGEAASDDALMQEAWRRFFDTLAVEARYHPELQRQLMPVRFWKDLPEMKPQTHGLARG